MHGLAASMAIDPDEAKREELQENPDFKKILKVLKMGISIMQVRQNMTIQGKFDPDDIIPFCSSDQLMTLKKSGTFNEKEYEKKREKYCQTEIFGLNKAIDVQYGTGNKKALYKVKPTDKEIQATAQVEERGITASCLTRECESQTAMNS